MLAGVAGAQGRGMSVPVTGARLSLADFVPDSAAGVLLRAGRRHAGRVPGRRRARLLEGLPAVADRSTGSDELAALVPTGRRPTT